MSRLMDILNTSGRYHGCIECVQYVGGMSSFMWGDTLGIVQYIGGISYDVTSCS